MRGCTTNRTKDCTLILDPLQGLHSTAPVQPPTWQPCTLTPWTVTHFTSAMSKESPSTSTARTTSSSIRPSLSAIARHVVRPQLFTLSVYLHWQQSQTSLCLSQSRTDRTTILTTMIAFSVIKLSQLMVSLIYGRQTSFAENKLQTTVGNKQFLRGFKSYRKSMSRSCYELYF